MNMPVRWCAAGIAGVLAASLAASAAEPVIDITNEAARDALQDTHRQQIDEYVAYQVDKMAKATGQNEVVAARRKLTDIYNRYGSKAQEFMSAFAASMAKHGKAMLARLAADDPLRTLKEVNLSITVLRMGQVTLGPLADVMVSHADPAVRYYGWIAYAAMRVPVMAAGGKAAQAMYTVLAARMQKEDDPQVLAEMVRIFTFRDMTDVGSAISPEAYTDGLARLFKILDANWVGLCRKVMQADGNVAEAASTALSAVVWLKSQLKDKVSDQATIQLVADVTWSAGKAFDLSLASLDAKPLGSRAAQIEYAVSTITEMLKSCESSLNLLSGRTESFINTALVATSVDRAAGVRLAVLRWVDLLVKEYKIKRPEDVVPPKEAPALK